MSDTPVLGARQTLAAAMDAIEAQAKAKAQMQAETLLAKAEAALLRARADAEAAAAKAKQLATRAELAERTRDERARVVADGVAKGRVL